MVSIDGPIPACAGEPFLCQRSRSCCRAYPRMRGGTPLHQTSTVSIVGLSPHARGNHTEAACYVASVGPIPACAGEPFPRLRRPAAPWAYPRMRGGTRLPISIATSSTGLSPHARGNLLALAVGVDVLGPIPACAGEPLPRPAAWCRMRAYPRMRGGTSVNDIPAMRLAGLSPHARGNLFSSSTQ